MPAWKLDYYSPRKSLSRIGVISLISLWTGIAGNLAVSLALIAYFSYYGGEPGILYHMVVFFAGLVAMPGVVLSAYALAVDRHHRVRAAIALVLNLLLILCWIERSVFEIFVIA